MKIETREIEYSANGTRLVGYFAVDADANKALPGVLVVHEWWGHNDYVRGRAEQLAQAGFAALALDMYGDGKAAETPEQAQALMTAVRETDGAIEQRFAAAYELLASQANVDAGNISAMGYCFGGAVVLGMARAGKNLQVAASFHGLLQTETPMPKNGFSGKLLVFNGADDPMVTPDILDAFNKEMTAADIDYRVVDYPGVVHGFTNPAATARGEATGMPLRYDEAADKDSWQHTILAINAAQSDNAA